MNKFTAWFFSRWTNVGINVGLAIFLGACALVYDTWVRDWLWFCAGVQVGFAIMWVMAEYQQAIAREKMKAEMHVIGADTVRRMHEMYDQHHAPLVPNLPRDEPPRLH